MDVRKFYMHMRKILLLPPYKKKIGIFQGYFSIGIVDAKSKFRVL